MHGFYGSSLLEVSKEQIEQILCSTETQNAEIGKKASRIS